MPMIKAAFHFLLNNQNSKQRMFDNKMMGKAIPMNEKKGVLRGDINHAGKDKKSRNMDMKEIPSANAFIIFCTITYKRLLLFLSGIKKLTFFFGA